MKKILENMIIKWHQAGYSIDEIGATRAASAQSRNRSTHPPA